MNAFLHGVTTALNGMNPLDWFMALILAVSMVSAFLRGLIRSLVSLAGLLAGVVAAAWYTSQVAAYLHRWISPPSLARIVAFILILSAVYMAAALLGRALRGAAGAVGLGFLDRLAGAGFGLVRGVLLLAALLLPLAPVLPEFGPARESVLLPYLLPAAHGISFVMPRDFGHRISAGSWLHHAGASAHERMRPETGKSPLE